jgi:hypothetical protein
LAKSENLKISKTQNLKIIKSSLFAKIYLQEKSFCKLFDCFLDFFCRCGAVAVAWRGVAVIDFLLVRVGTSARLGYSRVGWFGLVQI